MHFYKTLKDACDARSAALYPTFKKWCDEYFHIPRRLQSCWINGLFDDDLSEEPHKRFAGDADAQQPHSQANNFAFVKCVGYAFVSFQPWTTSHLSAKSRCV